jgi:hypothetical protein
MSIGDGGRHFTDKDDQGFKKLIRMQEEWWRQVRHENLQVSVANMVCIYCVRCCALQCEPNNAAVQGFISC